MYTYLPVVNQTYYLIFKDNNPIPQAKAYSESTAQTIVNALNFTNQFITEINNNRMIPGWIAQLLHKYNWFEDVRRSEEIEEAGPPQPRIPERIPCRYCKGIATRMIKTPYLHTCSCGARYDNEMDQWILT